MSFSIPGARIPTGPTAPSTVPSGPSGLVRPSDLTGGPLPQGPGPAGLTGRPPRLLANTQSMPPRRNALPSLRANQPQDMSAVPATHAAQPHDIASAHPAPQGGGQPPMASPLSLNGLQSMHPAQPGHVPAEPPPPMPPPGGPGPGPLPNLAQATLSAASDAGNDAMQSQNAMMVQMQQVNLQSMMMQMQMAQMQNIMSLGTALAKVVKAAGDGVKGMAPN